MKGEVRLIPIFLLVLATPVIAAPGSWGSERVLFGIFLEAALLAIVTALRIRTVTLLSLLGTGAIVMVGLAIFCASDRIGSVLAAHLLLGSFAGFLHSASGALGRPLGPRAGPLIASILGLALLVSPLAMDPLLALAGPGPLGSHLLRLALILNPPAAIASSLFDVDWIREGSLYVRTRFASSRPFVYPSWGLSAVAYLALWGAAASLGRLGRRRSGRGVEDGGDPSTARPA